MDTGNVVAHVPGTLFQFKNDGILILMYDKAVYGLCSHTVDQLFIHDHLKSYNVAISALKFRVVIEYLLF